MSIRQPGATEPSSLPRPGTLLAGKYRLQEELARGGMGCIYKAEQLPLGRIVAIKLLDVRYEADEDPGFQDRFKLEAATLARLKHQNTVTLFDYGDDGESTYYLVMEYVEGRNLAQLLRTVEVLQPVRALRIAYEIARSLTEAHALGIVHRDLKPGNVMVIDTDEGETVKVVDFGIVKVLEDSPANDTITRPDRMVGSPRYMAPEQIRKGTIDGRTDIYALGVVLFEMLTGQPPFKGESSIKTLMSHLQDPVPPMSELTSRPIPPPVEQLVRRCLQKKPENRFPDISAFKRAVRAVLTEVGGAAIDTLDTSGEFAGTTEPPIGQADTLATPAITEPPPRRLLWLLPVALLVFVGLFGGASVLGWVAWRGLQPTPPAVVTAAPAPQPSVEPTPAPLATPADPAEAFRNASAWIVSDPEGAEIWEADAHLGPAPRSLTLGLAPGDPPRVFELRMPGHRTARVSQGPSPVDVDLRVKLERLPTAPRPVAPAPQPALDIRIER